MQETRVLHLEGLREEGLPIPQPSTVAYVDVVA
jgi:predicted RNase H-like HicB family nuclease